MPDQATAASLIGTLAKSHRILTLGGFAVISHGHSRSTSDADILYLEQKAETECLAKLSTASATDARDLLGRFLTPNLAAAAARHADAGVRELALRYLKELADEGDPFAADLLRTLPNADA